MRMMPARREGLDVPMMAAAALAIAAMLGCNNGPGAPLPPGGPDEPIEAEALTWQWAEFPESKCADGSPTGIGVNLRPGATRAYIYFQGGGACWNYETCFGVPTAFNLDGFDADDFDGVFAQLRRGQTLFDRDDPENPMADAHHVFVPYCTGDGFAGSRVVTLTGPLGLREQEIHFNGAENVRTFLRRLGPTFEGVEHVVVAGSSAGGFGATLNWWALKDAFPDARVDVINDGGAPVEPVEGRWRLWQHAWGVELPVGCDGCEDSVMAVVEHAGRTLSRQGRFGLLSSDGDLIISTFMGHTQREFGWQLRDLADAMDDIEGMHYFITEGGSHTFLLNRLDGVLARDGQDLERWIGEMIEGDPEWSSAR